MPGITGVISRRPGHECESLVRAMVASMEHEPFYTSGMYSVPEMGVYGGWIALEHSFAAGQVFLNEHKDIALILSGECFVDPETRSQLKATGHELQRTQGDWLVHFYEEEGGQFFEKLNGLFSGLLIDKRQGRALLFNDRYGVERIYWYETKDGLYFASEAKALLRILPALRAFDREGVAQFLTFGCTLEGRTLFQDVQLLPGGSLWSFEGENCHKGKYFSAETWQSQPILSAESFEAGFQEKFKEILPRYFESESKIGISLTAGLDSRMIMACCSQTSERPICYTFSGEKQDTLDARLAGKVAATCGLEHHILRISADFFSDFPSHVDRTVYVTDGCLGALGAHEIYLNKKARDLSPVRITGVFGGEILRGVSMFKPIRLSPRLVNQDFSQFPASAQQWRRNGEHPLTFTAFREVPEKRFGIPAASRSQVSFRTPYLDNEIVALAYRTPPSLLMSALPALRLVKGNRPALSNIPTDMGEMGKRHGLAALPRQIVSKAAFKLDYFHNEGLPHWLSSLDPLFRQFSSSLGIAGLHKFLHYRSWFQHELAPYVNGILKDPQTGRSPFWNSEFLEHMVSEHMRGGRSYLPEIDAVLTLEAVERLLFRDFPREPNVSATSAVSTP